MTKLMMALGLIVIGATALIIAVDRAWYKFTKFCDDFYNPS